MFRRLGTVAASRCLTAVVAAAAPAPAPHALCPPPMRTTAATLRTARRGQGSLQSLMRDPEDAYLDAIQQLDLPRIAVIVAAGPSLAPHRAAAAERLHREQSRILHQAPSAAALQRGSDAAGAVLSSLRAEGLRRVAATQAAEEAALAEAARRQSPAEHEARAAALRATHLYEGLCAASAVLRVQVEDGAITAEELDAAYDIFVQVVRRRAEVPAEQWAEDFVPELKSFQFIFNAKDNRELAF